VYSPKTAVNPLSVVALLGSPNLTMGQGCKTGVSLLIPTMWRGGKTGVSLVGRSGILRRMVSADPEAIGCGLGGLGWGGFGGGWTLLGPDLTSQFLDRHSLIQAFMLVKFFVGMLLAFMWLFLFLQSEKQYFWRNQRGQQQHASFHFGPLLTCLHAKFIAHISVVSMYSLGWGALFFNMARSSSFFFFFCRLSSLPLSSFLSDANFAVAVAATAGSFIWKVGKRL
jgi:hypothetical protein